MSIINNNQATTLRTFHITVLGRTLEHLGVQMYKRRDIAIAELVANSWDAGATRVEIVIPDENEYDPATSEIIVTDNGFGMNDEQVQNEYLVVGRNRRSEETENQSSRPVMGRKGIGKLAGFGVASEMTVITWQGNRSTMFTLDVHRLKTDAGLTSDVPIAGVIGAPPTDSNSTNGTRIVLRNLKHKSPLSLDSLREALSRRFSRRVHGEMAIYVNGVPIGDPHINIERRFPEEGFAEEVLADGSLVRYYYAFARSNIASKELQGFTIYVRGKTAQAPPFFFHVETRASGLQWSRYMTGEIEADFLDEGSDDATDLISTDRQEIDWADERSQVFRAWGEAITRRALREWATYKGESMEIVVMEDRNIYDRVMVMEKSTQRQISNFLRQIGQTESDPEHALALADSLVRAFEYRHFHDVIAQIESASDNPEQLSLLLTHLGEWKVLESRAILEVIKGRLEVIEKFHSMIVNNAPETASSRSLDNMHDLLAGYPWILNPEWQVLSEETRISTQLRAWNIADITDEDTRMRYDFLALTDDRRLVIIEIKRPAHSVELDELHRLETYTERLARASGKELYMVMLCGGTMNLSPSMLRVWEDRPDGEIRTWRQIYDKTHAYYKHYRAVLEGDIHNTDFAHKEREIAQTRHILQPGGTHRSPETRRLGLGIQDRDDQP